MAVKTTAKLWGPRSSRSLTVYIEADNSYEIEDTGYADARVIANKRGFSISNDIEVTEPTPSAFGGWAATMSFHHRWRVA